MENPEFLENHEKNGFSCRVLESREVDENYEVNVKNFELKRKREDVDLSKIHTLLENFRDSVLSAIDRRENENQISSKRLKSDRKEDFDKERIDSLKEDVDSEFDLEIRDEIVFDEAFLDELLEP